MICPRTTRFLPTLLLTAASVMAQSGSNHDLQRASQLLGKGRPAEAEQLLVRLAEFEPQSRSIWYQLALSRQLQGKNELALSPVQRALTIDEKFVPAQLLALRIELATAPGRARARIERIVELDGENADTLFRLARIALRDLRSPRLAGSMLERAQAIRPDSTEGLQLQAELLVAEGSPRAALPLYDRLIAASPRNPALHQAKIVLLAALDRTQDTLRACRRLLEIQPSNLAVRERLVGLLRATGADVERIELQQTYLAYYRKVLASRRTEGRVDARRSQPDAKPPSRPPGAPPASRGR